MVRESCLEKVCYLHHYVGVPYAQKYWQKGPKSMHRLFLDCCGLVRRILGYGIRPWLRNWAMEQSYLYDTLPEDIPFDKLKPGDLIFYRAFTT